MQQTENAGIKSWLVDEHDFPIEGGTHDRLQFLLNYAVLAQSYYNSQPWKFSLEDNQINLYVDESHWLKTADPDKRELFLSVGCALENLLIAAEHFKIGHQVAHFPDSKDPNWVARVKFTTISQSTALRSPELFGAITKRHTHHQPFEERSINESDLQRIEKFLTEEDIWLEVSDDPKVKDSLGELASHANTILYGDPQFRAELRDWARTGTMGLSWFLPQSGQMDDTAMQEAGSRLGNREAQIMKSAPMIAVLSSPFDNRLTQVKAGQIFEKLCLEAALIGVRCLPVSQLIEVPEKRDIVQELFPSIKGNPLVVFAMGYGKEESAEEWSPRLPLDKVIAH
jgi:hypothetical protein